MALSCGSCVFGQNEQTAQQEPSKNEESRVYRYSTLIPHEVFAMDIAHYLLAPIDVVNAEDLKRAGAYDDVMKIRELLEQTQARCKKLPYVYAGSEERRALWSAWFSMYNDDTEQELSQEAEDAQTRDEVKRFLDVLTPYVNSINESLEREKSIMEAKLFLTVPVEITELTEAELAFLRDHNLHEEYLTLVAKLRTLEQRYVSIPTEWSVWCGWDAEEVVHLSHVLTLNVPYVLKPVPVAGSFENYSNILKQTLRNLDEYQAMLDKVATLREPAKVEL